MRASSARPTCRSRSAKARHGFRRRARRPKGRRAPASTARITDLPAFLTRTVTFAAAHRYRVAAWSDEKNLATFGLCARENFHGHSYTCDVTVTADTIDPVTGFVVDLGVLDRVLDREVKQRFDHANINLDVPEFGEGGMMPTGENLARFICERVQHGLGPAMRVVEVKVAEDHTLSVSYRP